MIKKFALIATGGGMACCWGAGVLKALGEYKFTPEIIIGISGNAGNVTYFKSGQCEVLKEIWVKHLASKKFIDFFRYPKIIDIEYLVKDILQIRFPLNESKFRKSPSTLIIASTSLQTGEPVWFHDWNRYNIFEVLHASKAMAVGYGKYISIENQTYIDVPSSHLVNLAIQEAVILGATHVILIDTTQPIGWLAHFFKKQWFKSQNQVFQNGYQNSLKKSAEFVVPKHIPLLSLRPRIDTPIFTRDPGKLKVIFENGFYETMVAREVEKFIER